jgi:hypothetical protein
VLWEINGTTVHLNRAKTYASLFLSMDQGRCGAVIPYHGHEDRVPDFKPESKADEK